MKSREEFEKFCENQSLNLAKDEVGYQSSLTEILWDTWKEATNRAANLCQAEQGYLFSDTDPWYSVNNCIHSIVDGNE